MKSSHQTLRAALRIAPLTALLAAGVVQAQGFPAKPLRIICPFPPAGAVDITSRAIAAEMTKSLGQTVQVDNRPGAGGNLGGELAAKAAPDGYTLFMTTSPIQSINPALYTRMPFDPNKDFAFVSVLVSLSNILVVHPSLPVRTVKELITLARSRPGQLVYASSGNGTSIHLSAELFRQMSNTQMVHVPYKGSAPAITDLIGGQTQLMFDNIPSAAPHAKSGKLRALGVTSPQRSRLFPEVPTIAEAALPGYEAVTWFGLSVPAATPREIAARLSTEAIKGTQSKEFRARMESQGFDVVGSTPEQMAEMTRAHIARWVPVVKASGAKLD